MSANFNKMLQDAIKRECNRLLEQSKKMVPKDSGSLRARIRRKRLPNSAFADPWKRRFPIIDAPHVRLAIMTFEQYSKEEGWAGGTENFSEKERLQVIHDRIFKAAKRFGVKHNHNCRLCEEKVVFT